MLNLLHAHLTLSWVKCFSVLTRDPRDPFTFVEPFDPWPIVCSATVHEVHLYTLYVALCNLIADWYPSFTSTYTAFHYQNALLGPPLWPPPHRDRALLIPLPLPLIGVFVGGVRRGGMGEIFPNQYSGESSTLPTHVLHFWCAAPLRNQGASKATGVENNWSQISNFYLPPCQQHH